MRIQERWRWAFAFLGFTIAGLASAITTLWLRWTPLSRVNVLGSVTLGFFLCICLWLFFGLRSIWKSLVFITLSMTAALLSLWTAVLLSGRLVVPPNPNDLRLYFIGGYVGAFFLLVTGSLLIAPKTKLFHQILQSLSWAGVGGVLAVVGSISAPWFHMLRMHFDPRLTEEDLSLISVWHIGMALVLAVALYVQKKRPRAVGPAGQ